MPEQLPSQTAVNTVGPSPKKRSFGFYIKVFFLIFFYFVAIGSLEEAGHHTSSLMLTYLFMFFWPVYYFVRENRRAKEKYVAEFGVPPPKSAIGWWLYIGIFNAIAFALVSGALAIMSLFALFLIKNSGFAFLRAILLSPILFSLYIASVIASVYLTVSKTSKIKFGRMEKYIIIAPTIFLAFFYVSSLFIIS